MQRSRKYFLQRRALEKTISIRNRLYKISLSLVFVLWGLILLVSLWTSRGYRYKDESGVAINNCSVYVEDLSSSKISHQKFSANVDKTSNSQDKDSYFRGNEYLLKEIEYREVDKNQVPSNCDKELLARNERMPHIVPPSLDEFKGKVYNSRSKSVGDQIGSVKHRVEPGGAEYNYASSSKGAKVLANNKEAKGAVNILCKDEDKYLRNPCSAEEKFVVIELSEETLVDTIEIANFEHHSSTLKEFELLGSLVYPTDQWVILGNFTAANAKHAQSFALLDPKWVRYLRLHLISHYGSEFYCTLSVFEVYGVDAVERMLEDLISVQAGRIPGDAVLKILMQKVRSLDLDLSVLEWYSEDLNTKYGDIFKGFAKEMNEQHVSLEKMSSDLKNFGSRQEIIDRGVVELVEWKSLVSARLNDLVQENSLLRSEMEKVKKNQNYMDHKGRLVLMVSLLFGLLAFLGKMVAAAACCGWSHNKYSCGEFCTSSWVLLIFSSFVILILTV